MKTNIMPYCAIAFCLLLSSQSFGMGGNHDPNQPIYGNDGWPPDLVKAMNGAECVGGFWVNQSDWFFFKGETRAANRFFEKCGRYEKTLTRVVLHPGSGFGQTPWDKERVPCDWMVSVERRGWTQPKKFEGVPEDVDLLIVIDLWLGGDIHLHKVKIPVSIDVKSDGKIEKFVAAHKISRKQAEKGNKEALEGSNKEEGEEGAVGE